jgi:hypothetical protein
MMIVRLLVDLLADLVFDSTATMRRSFRADVDRYYAERGLRSDLPPKMPAR